MSCPLIQLVLGGKVCSLKVLDKDGTGIRLPVLVSLRIISYTVINATDFGGKYSEKSKPASSSSIKTRAWQFHLLRAGCFERLSIKTESNLVPVSTQLSPKTLHYPYATFFESNIPFLHTFTLFLHVLGYETY